MKYGIIGAMEEETRLILAALENKKESEICHLSFIEGQYKSETVILVQSGIGKVNSAIATTILVTQFSVDLVINTGSAGALADQLRIGDVVVGERLAYHDVDVRAFDYSYGQVPQMPLYYETEATLVERAKEVLNQTHSTVHQGLITSSDSFIASVEQKEHILEYFPQALCSEMEGASIGQTCYQLGVPFIVLRSISDQADGAASVDFDDFIIEAGRKSAEFVLSFIKV